jgi:uncharacterized membrane protein YdjX (TVP38/TMEM64 family)
VTQTKNARAGLLMLLALIVGISFLFLPVRDWFAHFQGVIESLGPLGLIVFVLAYVVLTMLLVPGSALTLGAGAMFGLWWGALVVIVGANLAALCSFLLARTFLRARVEQWAQAHSRFAALDRAIGRDGFKMVLLLRLSPIFPFTLLNYLLGLTNVRLSAYVLANLIGMLPGTFLYVYLGATARAALTGASGWLVKAIGLLATIAVVWLVTRTARRALFAAEQEATATPNQITAPEVR